MSDKTLDLDVTKETRFRSNVWLLLLFIGVTLAAYASWRDVNEYNRDRVREHLQQERHLEYSDSRITDLERRLASTERLLDRIDEAVQYIKEQEQRRQRSNQ